MRVKSLLVVCAALAAASPLAAQQQPRSAMRGRMHQAAGMMQGHEGMSAMDSMMAPMMQAMAVTPDHLLEQKAALHLTADQESRLTAIRDAARSEANTAAGQAGMHLREMVDVLHTASPDTAAMKHHFQAAMGFIQTAHWAMLRAAAQAWPVLTEAQQRQVVQRADSAGCCSGMMHGGMHGEMKHH